MRAIAFCKDWGCFRDLHTGRHVGCRSSVTPSCRGSALRSVLTKQDSPCRVSILHLAKPNESIDQEESNSDSNASMAHNVANRTSNVKMLVISKTMRFYGQILPDSEVSTDSIHTTLSQEGFKE